MKILKKLAALFSKKTPAPKQAVEKQNVEHQQTENGLKDPPCAIYPLGRLEYPAFTPQPLLSFYAIQKAIENRSAARCDISMIWALSLFHPETSAFICSAFAIKEEKGWIWIEIGSRRVNFSKPEAFIYRPAEKFRIALKKKDKQTTYMAVCEYKKEKVRVTAIIEEILTPPTDNDREILVECKKLPCSLGEAAEFVNGL